MTRFQVLLEENETWHDEGEHRVQAQVDCQVNVSPLVAQRHARTFLAMNVTMMTSVGVPILVIGEQPVWRLLAYFNMPPFGEIALLGSIDIDATSGEVVHLSPEQISKMQQRAQVIATRLTSPAAVAR